MENSTCLLGLGFKVVAYTGSDLGLACMFWAWAWSGWWSIVPWIVIDSNFSGGSTGNVSNNGSGNGIGNIGSSSREMCA